MRDNPSLSRSSPEDSDPLVIFDRFNSKEESFAIVTVRFLGRQTGLNSSRWTDLSRSVHLGIVTRMFCFKCIHPCHFLQNFVERQNHKRRFGYFLGIRDNAAASYRTITWRGIKLLNKFLPTPSKSKLRFMPLTNRIIILIYNSQSCSIFSITAQAVSILFKASQFWRVGLQWVTRTTALYHFLSPVYNISSKL